MIQIKLFASLRERLGAESVNFEYGGEYTVADVTRELVELDEKWKLLSEGNVLCAINQDLCGVNTKVHDGDELAFFPPVTGG